MSRATRMMRSTTWDALSEREFVDAIASSRGTRPRAGTGYGSSCAGWVGGELATLRPLQRPRVGGNGLVGHHTPTEATGLDSASRAHFPAKLSVVEHACHL